MNNKLTYLEDKITFNKVQQFFYENRYVLIIAILSGIYANILDIITFKIGIDTERFTIITDGSIYIQHQRYGSYILLKLFPFLQYHGISQITSIVILTIAGLLIINRQKLSFVSKVIFLVLLVTFPNFSFLEYFYFQYAYNIICVFLALVSYRLVEMIFLENKLSKWYVIIAVITLAVALSSYQAIIAIYLTVMMINIILDSVYKESWNYKKYIVFLFISTMVLIFAGILYYLSILILNDGVLYHYGRYDLYNKIGIYATLLNTAINIKNIMLSNDYWNYLFMLPANILYIVFIVIYFIRERSKEKVIRLIVLSFILLLAVFSINILVGRAPSRAMLALGFYFSFIFMISYDYCKIKLYRLIIFVLFIFALTIHIGYISKYSSATILQYEDDKRIAYKLINDIETKASDLLYKNYKLTIVGKIYTPQQKRIDFKKMKDVYGSSIFAWDNGNSARMIYFMYLMGLPTNIKLDNSAESVERAKLVEKNYPDENYIEIDNDHIYIKLQ